MPASASTARDAVDPAQQPVAELRADRPPMPLPAGQEHAERSRWHRLDLGAQRGERAAPDPAQHIGVAVVGAGAAEHVASAAASPRQQAAIHQPPSAAVTPRPQAEPGRDLTRAKGPVRAGVPPDQIDQSARDRLEEGLGDPDGHRHAEGVAQPPGILDDRPLLPLARHPPRTGITRRAAASSISHRVLHRIRLDRAQREIRRRDRAEQPHQVHHTLLVPRMPSPRSPPPARPTERANIEQVRDIGEPLAEQLREQVGVECQRGGAALRERRVALVEELRDIPEQQRLRER